MKHIDLRDVKDKTESILTLVDAVSEAMQETVLTGQPQAVQMTNNHKGKPLTLEISVKIVER